MRRYGTVACIAILLVVPSVEAATLSASLKVTVVPNAPENLSASATSPSQAVLSWTNGSNARVSVERRDGLAGSYVEIASTTPNIATYIDNSVTQGQIYFYRVRAFIGENYSTYSNEASAMTPNVPISPLPTPTGGGAGGGGVGYYIPPVFRTHAIFRGIAYPSSKVTLLQNGQIAAVTEAGPDANFEIDLSALVPGTYNFGVWAEDPNGNRSVVQNFQITLANGATTVVSGIFFPPTIGADKIKVKQGDLVTILGYTAPAALVTLTVHSTSTIEKMLTANASGSWIYKLNTGSLAYGGHTARARAVTPNDITADSAVVAFTVANENVVAPSTRAVVLKGDMTGDGRVNIIDFSILAYWFGRAKPSASIDVNHDGKVDLVDFSILAYYWTG